MHSVDYHSKDSSYPENLKARFDISVSVQLFQYHYGIWEISVVSTISDQNYKAVGIDDLKIKNYFKFINR